MENKMRPILFSPAMVEAVLSGQKTQTRRIIKPQPDPSFHVQVGTGLSLDGNGVFGALYSKGGIHADFVKCPYGKVGDILWVREKWLDASIGKKDLRDVIYFSSESGKLYDKQGAKWKPSIFMPREACRIFLKITDIRIEVLNKISDDDCLAEGVYKEKDYYYVGGKFKSSDPKWAFLQLWESINGVNSWDNNPFLWVVKFEIIDEPAY
jgi:hypothetical protein